jgi:hypothetical protein
MFKLICVVLCFSIVCVIRGPGSPPGRVDPGPARALRPRHYYHGYPLLLTRATCRFGPGPQGPGRACSWCLHRLRGGLPSGARGLAQAGAAAGPCAACGHDASCQGASLSQLGRPLRRPRLRRGSSSSRECHPRSTAAAAARRRRRSLLPVRPAGGRSARGGSTGRAGTPARGCGAAAGGSGSGYLAWA